MSSLLLDYTRYQTDEQWSGTIRTMKKAWLIIAGIGIVIAGAILYLMLTNRPANSPATTTTSEPPDNMSASQNSQQQAATETQTPGKYEPYSAEAVAKVAGRKILFFHAPWCPQCRALEKSIQAGTIPSGVTIFKVDYDSSTSLRQKYGVTIQTTLVEIEEDGGEIQKYVAYDSPNLSAVINAMKL